jgi:hypothetical protein
MTTISDKADFLLLFRNTELSGRLTPEQITESMRRLNEWLEKWSATGHIKAGQPLGPEGKVISGAKQRAVVDGPFAEAKEVLGGYVLVSAADLAEATQIAEEWPMLDVDASVEVRPVLEMCPHLAEWRQANLPEPALA